MRKIDRLTVAYDAREDRLRLSTLDREGASLVLWLTRRLADRLVAALVKGLEAAVEADGGRDPAGGGSGSRETGLSGQYWEQTNADLRMKPRRAVVAPAEGGEEGLLESVGVRIGAKRYQLEFKWADGDAALPMDETFLRQLLRILHRNYKRGNWQREGIWPAWFADDAHKALIGANQVN